MPDFFEFPPTRSNRVKWALLELDVAYTSHLVDLRVGEHHSDAYKAIHPLEVVPAYRCEDYTMFESVATVMQLIDEHPNSGLAPPPASPARAAYYQWCVFASAELDPALADVMLHTMHLASAQRVPAIAERGRERFHARAQMLALTLQDRDYILGEQFSGADIVLGYCCNWAAYTGMIGAHPGLEAYYARLAERPAFAQVFPS
jgi:glutathione S-transferase